MDRRVVPIALFFSAATSAMHFSVIDNKYDCPEIHNSMECARSIENTLLEKYSFIQRITDKSLLVKFSMEGEKHFNDEEVSYSAIEYLEDFDYLVLVRQFWEGSGYGLLNMNTGDFYLLAGYPLFSPDGKYLVAVNQDLDAEYSPNTLQIYKVSPTVELVFDAKPTNWGPGRVSWLNENTVAFEKTMISDEYNPLSNNEAKREPYSREPSILSYAGDKWVMITNN